MGNLDRLWRIREDEERERRHRRKLKEMSDAHWERVRSYSDVSLWIVVAIVLYLAISFARFAYGVYQARQSPRPVVETPAATPQGHPPQNTTRRSRAQEAPARK